MTSPDHTGMGDVGNTSCGLASSKDAIIIAETGIVCDKEIAVFGTGFEHTNMEDVVSISVGQSSSQDADNIVHSSLNGNNDKAVKFKNRKPQRGIKVSTPTSAGAGSVLRCLRSAKVTGKARGRADESPGSVLRRLRSAKVFRKARGRADESPGDNRGGKR
nr:hypothetical protein [Tanacetum cinerariifolium]